MHSSMHYEITTKSIQLFAESVQNPNMHYEIVYCTHSGRLGCPAREKGCAVTLGTSASKMVPRSFRWMLCVETSTHITPSMGPTPQALA
jgi:hypothetical protein